MIPLTIYSQLIVLPLIHQSRSQAWTYQNENPKKTKTNTIKTKSSISITRQDIEVIERVQGSLMVLSDMNVPLQHLSEGLFALAFDEGENSVFRLELCFTIGDDHLFTADHRNKDGTCRKG